MSVLACARRMIPRGVTYGLPARGLRMIIPAHQLIPHITLLKCLQRSAYNLMCGFASLIRLYGSDEAFVVEAFLVELGQLFVALGGDGLALGVGLHHDIDGPLYGHTRDDLL